MTRSAEWEEWQRAAWQQGPLKRKAPAPAPTENSFRPHKRPEQPAANIAGRIYPHLRREGS